MLLQDLGARKRQAGRQKRATHGAMVAAQPLEEWREGVKPVGGHFIQQLVKCLEGTSVPLTPPNSSAGC